MWPLNFGYAGKSVEYIRDARISQEELGSFYRTFVQRVDLFLWLYCPEYKYLGFFVK